MSQKITRITAEEIFDSRGKPTLKVTVHVNDYCGSFAVPSGVSTGKNEAWELRDNDDAHFNGAGILKAAANVNTLIAEALVGIEVTEQNKIDEILISLDQNKQKKNIGANATIGASIAACKAAAKSENLETFQYLQKLASVPASKKTPYLYANLIEGGKHAGAGQGHLAFQEYHAIPQTDSLATGVEWLIRLQDTLEKIIVKKYGPDSTGTGDEGGFAPDPKFVREPLELLREAAKTLGLTDNFKWSLDTAAASFYQNNLYELDDKKINADALHKLYDDLIKEFNLFSIEDPFHEEDFENFAKLKALHPQTLIVGDDLTVTNAELLARAIKENAIGGIIIKPNQIGTLSETLATMKLAKDNNAELIISHRGGETDDDFIADLAFAFGCFGIKAGGMRHGERLAKYNRLLEIENLQA